MATETRYWLIMPAAGLGERMRAERPKQYLPLCGRTVIEWSLQPFLRDVRCQGIVVALAQQDAWWPQLASSLPPNVHATQGGTDRAASVLAGLQILEQLQAQPEHWVLVHDAARPCLTDADLNALLAVAPYESVGALLATPITETIKRAIPGAPDEVRVAQTVSRDQLWRAQTPQMFKFGLLQQGLDLGMQRGTRITDESSAIEELGLRPRLVEGRADNLKITLPEDLLLAERILGSRLQ